MSARSIRRARQRRLAGEQRREELRRRRAGLAVSAAIGAGALFAPGAQAATFQVNSLADGPVSACDATCTLRDAVAAAEAAAGADAVTFESTLSGTITLTEGEIPIASGGDLTITGPGAAAVTVSGGAASRIFNVSATPLTLSGLTLNGGYSTDPGGAIFATGSALSIADAAITGSHSDSSGGAIYSDAGPLTVERTNLSGNGAGSYGGAVSADDATISHSTVSSNSAGGGGGLAGTLKIDASTVTGNLAGIGGGIFNYGGLEVTASTISSNSSFGPGGGLVDFSLAPSRIDHTTIAGNSSGANGAGLYVGTLGPGADLTVSHSTISGNSSTGPGTRGGGIMLPGAIYGIAGGDFTAVDSTVSGNVAAAGAGIAVGNQGQYATTAAGSSIGFANTTIASNRASGSGGGVYLGQYDSGGTPTSSTIQVRSTIVGDNTASGAAEDLDRVNGSTGGGFELAFSLVEAPGDAPLTQDPLGSSIVGSDPALGGLADNGGATFTHLPARTSPVVDSGLAGAGVTTDQRDQPRTVDLGAANASGGDATDIGSVELAAEPPPPPPEPPAPPPPAPPPVTPQDLAPQALIKHNGLRARKASRRHVTGIATDDHAVAKVEIALVLKRGGKCRELRASGRFSKAHRCRRPRSFVAASGTKSWSFKLSHRLKRGYYVVYSRATDDAGHTQLWYGTKSRRPFRVR